MLLYNIAMECHHEHNEILPKEPHIFDKIAVIISAICLAHCLIVPVLIIILPFLGFLAHDTWVHTALIFMAAPISAFALWRNGGWRDALNLTLAIIGILLLGVGAFGTHLSYWETPLSVCGALLVGYVHLRNLHLHTGGLSH